MEEKTKKKVYVFIAGEDAELSKYPGGELGFREIAGSRVLCRYRPISDDSYIFILGNFVEKERLSDKTKCDTDEGWIIPPDESQMFVAAIVGMVDRALLIDRLGEGTKTDYVLHVFAHMSGVGIEADRSNDPHDAVQLLQEAERAYTSASPSSCLVLPMEVRFHAISTTAHERLDLTVPKIRLPENEDEMNMLLERCENRAAERGEIYNAFVKKWGDDKKKWDKSEG